MGHLQRDPLVPLAEEAPQVRCAPHPRGPTPAEPLARPEGCGEGRSQSCGFPAPRGRGHWGHIGSPRSRRHCSGMPDREDRAPRTAEPGPGFPLEGGWCGQPHKAAAAVMAVAHLKRGWWRGDCWGGIGQTRNKQDVSFVLQVFVSFPRGVTLTDEHQRERG
ncbi:unnamed protein product [Ixodes pacificus]